MDLDLLACRPGNISVWKTKQKTGMATEICIPTKYNIYRNKKIISDETKNINCFIYVCMYGFGIY